MPHALCALPEFTSCSSQHGRVGIRAHKLDPKSNLERASCALHNVGKLFDGSCKSCWLADAALGFWKRTSWPSRSLPRPDDNRMVPLLPICARWNTVILPCSSSITAVMFWTITRLSQALSSVATSTVRLTCCRVEWTLIYFDLIHNVTPS